MDRNGEIFSYYIDLKGKSIRIDGPKEGGSLGWLISEIQFPELQPTF
jgi:hypothetical protein